MSNFVAEIFGTMILIVMGNGVVAGVTLKDSGGENSGFLTITAGYGLAVALGVFAVGSISGAHLNPAVTLAMAIASDFGWSEVATYISGQMIGAFLGAVIVWAHYLPHWARTEDAATKLGTFSTSPAVPSRWANLLSEVIGTFILIAGLLFIGAKEYSEGLFPLLVGVLVFAIGMSLGGTTGYAINPARDLAPRIAHALLPIPGKGDSNWTYAPIPIVGPIIGGILGGLVYNWLYLQQTSILLWILLAVFIGIVFMAYREQGSSKA